MNTAYAYELGKYAALAQLNLRTKAANVGRYILPSLGGGALGAGTGALAAPQGQEMEGALLGAGIGAGAGAAGKAVARQIPKSKARSAAKSYGELSEEVMESSGPFGAAHSEKAPELKRLQQQMEEVEPSKIEGHITVWKIVLSFPIE